MRITYAAICETGNREGRNQDRIFTVSCRDAGLFLVADGMGGHLNGAFASRCIQEETERIWEDSGRTSGGRSNTFYMEELCVQALKKANHRIRASVTEQELCGSTAVLVYIGKEEASVFSCGDSRCYRMEPGLFGRRLKQITVDDIWENSPEAKGYSTRELKMHKNRGKLSRAVGTEKVFSCSIYRLQLNNKNLLILCSDGVYKFVCENTMRKILKNAASGNNTLAETVERIREEVYEAGAKDNLSLILILAEKE